MQLFLAAAPEHTRQALAFTANLAHGAYSIGPEGTLICRGLERGLRGGILLLGDGGCGSIGDVPALAREIRRERTARCYRAVAADFELPPNRDRIALVRALDDAMAADGKELYVTEPYAKAAPRGRVLVCTALSGGSLRLRLEEAVAAWGRERVALDLQRLRMSFPLPCPTGCGRDMDESELEALLEKHRPNLFYSGDLCAKYFTCREKGETRFVLFDDGDTMEKNIALGRSMGISTGFLLYNEVRDLLPGLLRANRQQSRCQRY